MKKQGVTRNPHTVRTQYTPLQTRTDTHTFVYICAYGWPIIYIPHIHPYNIYNSILYLYGKIFIIEHKQRKERHTNTHNFVQSQNHMMKRARVYLNYSLSLFDCYTKRKKKWNQLHTQICTQPVSLIYHYQPTIHDTLGTRKIVKTS